MTRFQPPRGIRDYGPEETVKRNYVFRRIREVFERYGFDELDTPAVESYDLLSAKGGGGEEIKKEIYYFKDQAGRELGLRFEFTTSAARYVTNNPNLSLPFKKYQIGKVWRYDRPQKGRYREFYQCDADIIGSAEPEADAEIISMTVDALKAVGFSDFYVKVNSRNLLEGLLVQEGVPEGKCEEFMRSLDKLDKIGEEGVLEELVQKGFPEPLAQSAMSRVTSQESLYSGLDKIKPENDLATKGFEELEGLARALEYYSPDAEIVLDLSLARGLGYYTGLVFEVWSKEFTGSLAGGGRWDNLIGLLGGKSTPATGIAIGVERLILLMEEKGMFKDLPKTACRVFVAPVNDQVRKEAFKILKILRSAGINAETDLMKRKLRKQLEYAAAKGVPYVVFVGPKDLAEGEVTVRDMRTGEEKKVRIDDITSMFS